MANIYLDGANYLVDFDKDAENFIYASGINNPANLNVDGLYTSEQAMYAVNYLVSGLKAIGVWNGLVELKPFVGGNINQYQLDLKYLNTKTINLSGATLFNQGIQRNTVNIQTVTLLNDLSLYSRSLGIYVYEGQNNNSAYDIGALNGTYAFGLGFGSTGIVNFLPNTGADNRVTAFDKGLMQVSISNSSTCFMSSLDLVYSRTPGANGLISGTTINIGNLGGAGFTSNRKYNLYYISNVGYSSQQLKQINNLFDNFNSMLNRNPFK